MKKLGIRHQVFLLAVLPTLCIALLLGAYFTSLRIHDLEQNFREKSLATALRLIADSEIGVLSRNKVALQDLAYKTMKEKNLKGIAFYSVEGDPLIAAGTFSLPFELPSSQMRNNDMFTQEHATTLSLTLPISSLLEVNGTQEINSTQNDLQQKKTHIGWLKVEFDSTAIHLSEYQILINTGMILLLGLSISGLHALHMGRNVTRPILELAQAVGRIRKGDLRTRIRTSVYPELQALELGINAMTEALEDAQTELQNKVDTATASLRSSLETIEMQNLDLKLARGVAETASRVKSEFLADMSHEIRTPLNAIVGFINLLKKTTLNLKQTEYVQVLSKSSNTLLSIINDILDFSKIEAGKLTIERVPMNIQECVEDCLNLLMPNAVDKSLALIPMIYSDIPLHVMGDALRIKQVLTNLVNNAIKYTDQGSIIVRVMLEREYQCKALIRISVTDTGIGLSTLEQQELFKAFRQLKNGINQKFAGTGLGLVISKKLVEQMDGEIGLESELGKGATFWFTFEVDCLRTAPFTPSTTQSSSNEPLFTVPLKVLIVDDNPENLKLIDMILRELNIQTKAASSGQAAVQFYQEAPNEYHLIFMDIRMPGMNGIEATHHIREYEKTHNIKPVPIIALTAHALINEREALLKANIDDCMTKPIDEQTLYNIIRKWSLTRSSLPILDHALAIKLAGGKKELAEELLTKLLSTLPNDLEQMQTTFEEKDWERLRDQVHRLHGACCYCGVPTLKKCAHKLENTIATRALDIIQPRFDELKQAIQDLMTLKSTKTDNSYFS